jgi:predicted HTH transcriptional regulator
MRNRDESRARIHKLTVPTMSIQKTVYEKFAHFCENPSRSTFREFCENNTGEHRNLDFKEEWPENSKLSRHLLAFGNSGGGCIVFGIKDGTFDLVGIGENKKDETNFRNGIKKYLPEELLSKVDLIVLPYNALDYPKLSGKTFQVCFVEDDPTHLPYIAAADGIDIKRGAIYVRRGAASEPVNHHELQEVINRRISTGYSSQKEIDLQTHIEQLKVLYKYVKSQQKNLVANTHLENIEKALAPMSSALARSLMLGGTTVANPNYKHEYTQDGLDAFITSLIDKKRKRIEIEIDVSNL